MLLIVLSYPRAYAHTQTHRSQQGLSLCHTSKSCVPYATVGSWQAGVSSLPISWEAGSKANEGPSGTITHAHSGIVVAGICRRVRPTEWMHFEKFGMHFLKKDGRICHLVVIALINDNSVTECYQNLFIYRVFVRNFSLIFEVSRQLT